MSLILIFGLKVEIPAYLSFAHLEVISHDKDHLDLLLSVLLLLSLAVLAFIRRGAHWKHNPLYWLIEKLFIWFCCSVCVPSPFSISRSLTSPVLHSFNFIHTVHVCYTVAYPGGMHRMHVHPPSPPVHPPPGHVHPPPSPPPERLVMRKDEAVGTGQQEKKWKFVFLRLDNFLSRIILYKKQKGFGEHTIQSVFETLRCCWETNNSRQPALPQTKCSEGCYISVNLWESAIACWHAYTHTSSCMCKVPVVLYFLCYLFKLWVYILKGQCHRIFYPFFSSSIHPIWGPNEQAKIFLIFELGNGISLCIWLYSKPI